MAGDFPPESGDDLTGIVRGDIGEPLPLSSLALAPPPDLVASLSPWQSPLRQTSLAVLPRTVSPAPLSPWESPLRQAVDASQLRGTSARGLPSGSPTRAGEPEKPVTPGFAVWSSPATFGTSRVQSDAEAPSPPVVSGVQDGLVRRATQTALRAILGAGVVDGLVATRNEKKPTPREPWQEPLVTGSTCSGKTSSMGDLSLARGAAISVCGCEHTQKNYQKPCSNRCSHLNNNNCNSFSCFCPESKSRGDVFDGLIGQEYRQKRSVRAKNKQCSIRERLSFASGEQVFRSFTRKMNRISNDKKQNEIRPPNAQPSNIDVSELNVLHDPGGWGRTRIGIQVQINTQAGPQNVNVVYSGVNYKKSYTSEVKKPKSIFDKKVISFESENIFDQSVFNGAIEINEKSVNFFNSSDPYLQDLSYVDGLLLPASYKNIDSDEKNDAGDSETIPLYALITPNLWPGGIIPFEFDPGEDDWDDFPSSENAVRNIIKEWENITNGVIYFKEVDEGLTETYAVDLQLSNSSGASTTYYENGAGASRVEWQANGTEFGRFDFSVRHELGHVIGLEHEQRRTDRNLFVSVADEHPGIFEDEQSTILEGRIAIGPYNGRSIMQYGETAGVVCNWSSNKSDQKVPDALFCPVPFDVYLPRNITLLDGSAVVEMYRYQQYGILPFAPAFDAYPDPLTSPSKDFKSEYLLYGDNIAVNTTYGFKIRGAASIATADNGDLGMAVSATSNDGSAVENDEVTPKIPTPNEKVKNFNPEGITFVFVRFFSQGKWFGWIEIGGPPGGINSDPAIVFFQNNWHVFVANASGELFYCIFDWKASPTSHDQNWMKVPGGKLSNIWQIARPAAAVFDNQIHVFTTSKDFKSINTCHISYLDEPIPSKLDQGINVTSWSQILLPSFNPISAPSAIKFGEEIVLSVVGAPAKGSQFFKSGFSIFVRVGGQKFFPCGQFSEKFPNPSIKEWEGQMFWCDWIILPCDNQINWLPGSNIALGSDSPNRFSVYTRGQNGHLFRRAFEKGTFWEPHWLDLGGVLASDPGVTENLIFALVGENLSTIRSNVFISETSKISSMNLGFWFKRDLFIKPDLEIEGGA